MFRLKEDFNTRVAPKLMEMFQYKSLMAVPRITKITLNMGVSEAVKDKKILDSAIEELKLISGQKPLVTKCRKSIASFKVREGQAIGCMVTIRSNRMYEFLDRLISVALPRTRDFRGIKASSFDGHGNFNLGIKEQIIFPEIDYEKISAIRGLNISITTTAATDKECMALLKLFNFPIRRS